MKNGSLLSGILVGLAVGAALGVLFAPDKGSATRKKITDKGGELANNLKDKLEGIIDDVIGRHEAQYEEEFADSEQRLHN